MVEGMDAQSPPPDEDRVELAPTMTTAVLKALAHPLRQKLLRLLHRQRHLRAADAATELGEPANKVSFHLRVLAEAGLIDEAPDKARDRRDRVWTAVKGEWNLGDPEHPVADEALGNAVIQSVVSQHNDLVRRVAAYAPEYSAGRDTTVRGTFVQTGAHLTRAEFTELLTVIHRAIRDAEAAHDKDDPDTRSFEIDIVAGDDTL